MQEIPSLSNFIKLVFNNLFFLKPKVKIIFAHAYLAATVDLWRAIGSRGHLVFFSEPQKSR